MSPSQAERAEEPRELWQPNLAEQIQAAETLLRGPIPYAFRLTIRELHEALTSRKDAQ